MYCLTAWCKWVVPMCGREGNYYLSNYAGRLICGGYTIPSEINRTIYITHMALCSEFYTQGLNEALWLQTKNSRKFTYPVAL